MNIIDIDRLDIPELAAYTDLTGRQLRRRDAPEMGLFIAESPKVIAYALDAGYEPLSLLMERRKLAATGELIARCGELPVYTADKETLAELTGYELTRGVLCAMRRRALPEPEDICRHAGRVAVLEGFVDPTNVGAAFRSAAALGMDALLVTPSCCDPLSRRSVRVSMGTVFQLPWTRLKDWPGPGLARLRAMGFKTAAMALSDRAMDIDDPRPAAEERLAMILGTEGNGLSPETLEQCDYILRIPMRNGVDSLNVAAAGAVAFWQLRKRDAATPT